MANKTKRITCLALALVLLLSLSAGTVFAAPAENAGSFRDTTGHPYASYIARAVELGLFSGFEDGTFRPDATVTRGQFVTVLWRMMKSPESTAEVPFTDIGTLNASFRKAIAWAYENNVVSGTTETTFNPGGTISRQQALTILYRLDGQRSGMETLFAELYRRSIVDFSDISSYAKNGMLWAIYNDIAVLEDGNKLLPGGGCSRALLSVFLVKYLDEYKDRVM